MSDKILTKLEILADAAKYDASCASSAAPKRSAQKGGVGATNGNGICHSYTPDGRCVSLLKILMTNYCMYDCKYCINRISSDVRRARFTVQEVVDLTIGFYKRNYIEGLFLSSGIIKSPDYTMEQMIEIAKTLRLQHDFQGYIHLKTIPNAAPELQRLAGLYADRLSINIELPTPASLTKLAPEKDRLDITNAMGRISIHERESKEDRKKFRSAPKFAPAGQSTQMIIGADGESDKDVLSTSVNLYQDYRLRRVYYSAFSPIPKPSITLPAKPAPLLREHRLYQADWLYRFYGFSLDEIVTGGTQGFLDLNHDPKTAWALKNRDWFPMDINVASREELLRIPGLGGRTVQKILQHRRYARLGMEELARMRVPLKKARPFIITKDYRPPVLLTDTLDLGAMIREPVQLPLFGNAV